MPRQALQLHRWLDRPLLGVALLLAAAGFAQFSPAAALGDVAEELGELGDAETLAEQAGLPGTVLGAGLAVIRLSALGALPLAALADRGGRRRTILTCAALGLLATVVTAGSPSYWWFVVTLAVARPFLTATDTIGEVLAAEHTGASDRAKALALLAAAYGIGSGSVAVLRGLAGDSLGFRAVFALAAVPLVLVAVAGRLVTEPERFALRARSGGGGPGGAVGGVRPMLRAVAGAGAGDRRRLVVMAAVTFASGFMTGPAATFLFVYAENVLDLSSAFTSALVVAAGITGLAGLVVGRFLSDRVGRRPTAAVALVLVAAAGITAYSGSVPALAVGYLAGILVGAAYGTPAVALATELFPTSIRASVAGWLVVAGVVGATSGLWIAGVIADAAGSFTGAMVAVCVPGGLAAGLFVLLPETRGQDLEHTAPDRLYTRPG